MVFDRSLRVAAMLAQDYSGHAWIARSADPDTVRGELVGILDLRNALQAEASDLVMAEAMKIGGVSGWLRCRAVRSARVTYFKSPVAGTLRPTALFELHHALARIRRPVECDLEAAAGGSNAAGLT